MRHCENGDCVKCVYCENGKLTEFANATEKDYWTSISNFNGINVIEFIPQFHRNINSMKWSHNCFIVFAEWLVDLILCKYDLILNISSTL